MFRTQHRLRSRTYDAKYAACPANIMDKSLLPYKHHSYGGGCCCRLLGACRPCYCACAACSSLHDIVPAGQGSVRTRTRWRQAATVTAPGALAAATANPYLRSPPPPRRPYGRRARSPPGVAMDPLQSSGGSGAVRAVTLGMRYAVTPPHPPEDAGKASMVAADG